MSADDHFSADMESPNTYTVTITANVDGSVNSFASGATPCEVDIGHARTAVFDQHSTPPRANVHPRSSEYTGKDLAANAIVITNVEVLEHSNTIPGSPAIAVSIPNSANLSRIESHGVVKATGHDAALHVITSPVLLAPRNVYNFKVSEVTGLATLKNAMHGAERHLYDNENIVQLWESHPMVKACQEFPDLFEALGLTEIEDRAGNFPEHINDVALEMKDRTVYPMDKSIYLKAAKTLESMPSNLPIENALTDLKLRFQPACGSWETLSSSLMYAGDKELGILPRYSSDELDRASTISVTMRISYIIPSIME